MMLAAATLLVRDYDEAIAWFRTALAWEVSEDVRLGGDKRWVMVRPPQGGAALLLARAANAQQVAAVGAAAGGRVAFFVHTGSIAAEMPRMKAAGVEFEEDVRAESYGKVAVFRDLYGNRWDLIEPAATGETG
jgi:catechol 2,3-dioxygenase-like lactoylglutathione lyase family enzyme